MTLPSSRTILLFTRAPEEEARAKRLPAVEGTRLFTGFLKGWTQRALSAAAELLVVTPQSSATELSRLLPNARIDIQSRGTFAERVESAFAAAFRGGAGTVLMVGGDTAPLDCAEIEEAFQHLESQAEALVLTPASDGGVNAIGFNAGAVRSLANIAWQSSDVCRQLCYEGRRYGLALLLTSPGHDLDCAADIGSLYRLSRSQSCWKAFRWLLLAVLLACRAAASQLAHATGRVAGIAFAPRAPPLHSLVLNPHLR